MSDYKFFLSSDIPLDVKVKICNLEGKPPLQSLTAALDNADLSYAALARNSVPELYVTMQLLADGREIALPVQTPFRAFSTQWKWDQWLSLPIKYRDLPQNAVLAFTVWDALAPRREVAVGGTTVELFGAHKNLRKGRQKLVLWLGQQGSGDVGVTPGKTSDTDDIDRLERLIKRYDRGDFERIAWLDRLTFRQVEKINQRVGQASDKVYLNIELPQFPYPVLFQEKESHVRPAPVMEHLELLQTYDPELAFDNPVEAKYRKLERVGRRTVDKKLKPNVAEKKQLSAIIDAPPTRQLTPDEKEMLWKFRYALTQQPEALTKFLRAVDWSDGKEASETQELMRRWAPIRVDASLELLSSAFPNKQVRAYAVSRLNAAADADLQYYLLQLVQALRYEPSDGDSPLIDFLIRRAVKNAEFGVLLWWYLTVEREDPEFSQQFVRVHEKFRDALERSSSGKARLAALHQQRELVWRLAQLYKTLFESKDPRPKKIQRLQQMVSKGGQMGELASFAPLPLPLKPSVLATGIVADRAYIFKSKLEPIRITFTTAGANAKPFTVLWKSGDDLRQDQLVLQTISLMDKLMQKDSLDCKLSPYRVLATSSSSGLMEYVPSQALSQVLAENGKDIRRYLAKHNPGSKGGVRSDVMDTFVKSSAGYCVITYLLGIGDRHLDNLLLSSDGHVFHIDFGFILGKDPKPFPPPMKITKEMVLAMGGSNSELYNLFKRTCSEAFLILRRHANLIINLWALMVDANVPGISAKPEESLVKLQDNFKLGLTDEQAVQYFQGLISESIGALFPQMMEEVHRWANYWRS